MSAASRIEIGIPVFATVGPVNLRLFPYTERLIPPDDSDDLPWAWGAMCRVTFHFGELVTTKKIRTRYAYMSGTGWPTESRPSDASLAEGRATVLANLRTLVARHGFTPPEFEVIDLTDRADQ